MENITYSTGLSILMYEHENIIDVLNEIKDFYSSHIVKMTIFDVYRYKYHNALRYGVDFKCNSEKGLNTIRTYVENKYGNRFIDRNEILDQINKVYSGV